MPFTTLDTSSNLSPADTDDLARTARWAQIAAIAAAVLVVVALTGGVLFGLLTHRLLTQLAPVFESMGVPVDPVTVPIIIVVLYVIGAGLFVMPVVFLFQFARRMQAAVRAGFDAAAFSEGMRAQRNLYTFSGVLVLLMLAGFLIWTALITFVLLAPPPQTLPMGSGV